MLRTIVFFVFVAIAAAASTWMVEHPGTASLEWQGYRLDTSMAVLTGVMALIAVVSALVYRVWGLAWATPGRIKRAREHARKRRAQSSLTQGLLALAVGDANEARKMARKAEMGPGDPILPMLLAAQAAQLAGDETEAEARFTSMLETPETEFLGVRGLLDLAVGRADWERGLELAQRAASLRPGAGDVAANLFSLQIRAGRLVEAEATLDRMISAKTIVASEGRRRRALLEYLLAQAADSRGNAGDAMQRAKRCNDLAPEFVPGTVLFVRLLMAEGKHKKAVASIETAWKIAPHPDLLDVYWTAAQVEDAMPRLRAVEILVKRNPEHPESLLALAGAALEARLWGEARRNLEKIPEDALTVRGCLVWARLAEADHNDSMGAREWLLRAAHARPDTGWKCDSCGRLDIRWDALCPECGGFDTLVWETPSYLAGVVPALPAPEQPEVLRAVAANGDADAKGEAH